VVKADTPAVAVEHVRTLDHRFGQVDAVAIVEAVSKCLRQPVDSAAEIDCPPMHDRHAVIGKSGEHCLDIFLAGGEELIKVPCPAPLSRSAKGVPIIRLLVPLEWNNWAAAQTPPLEQAARRRRPRSDHGVTSQP
jgi:hypothetical protein